MAIHHTNLYASKKYTSSEYADEAVTRFRSGRCSLQQTGDGRGILRARIQMLRDNTQYGLGIKTIKAARFYPDGYTYIKDSLTNRKGFKYYKDRDAKAPYLYNATTRQFITYDDEWSTSATNVAMCAKNTWAA